MRKIILIICIMTGVFSVSAQHAIDQILTQVEQNNATLAAKRKLRDAQIIEAKVGNSLPDPEVEYAHAWGRPSEVGKTQEITIKQSFDFPTVYANRNKLAKAKAEQYGNEYVAARQQLLFDAQSLCIEISSLRQQSNYLATAMENARKVVDMISRRGATGDASVLEENKARFEYIATRNAFKRNEIELSAAAGRLTNLNGGKTLVYEGDALADLPDLPDLRPLDMMTDAYLNTSPELLALIWEKNAAERDVKLSRGGSLPKLSLGYKYEKGGGERFNGIVVGMSIPIFSNRNNVKRAKAQAIVADAEISRAKIDIRSDLAQLYARAALLLETLEEYTDVLDYSRSAELLGKALDAGHISLADYFDQLQPVYDTYLTMIEIRRDYMLVCTQINMINL